MSRHVPTRTCIVCKQKFPKSTLRRFVCKFEQGEARFVYDPNYDQPGRGFYVCSSPKCLGQIDKVKVWAKKCKGVNHQ